MKNVYALLLSFLLFQSLYAQNWIVQDPQFLSMYGSGSDKASLRSLNDVWVYRTGSDAEFSKTQNGGSIWNSGSFAQINSFYSTPYSINGFSAIDQNTAWIMTYGAVSNSYYTTIWKTTNGGTTWVQQMTGLPNRSGKFIHFFDANVGVALIDKEFVPYNSYNFYRTTNGGTSWSLLPHSSSPAVTGNADNNSFNLVDNTIYIFEKNTSIHRIMKSTDQGLTWSTLTGTVGGTHRNIMTWSTALKGFIVEQDFTNSNVMVMKKTLDGGTTWNVVPYSGISTPYLTDIAYVPGTDILIGTGGPYYVGSWISSNGGSTWSTLDNSSGIAHFSVDCMSSNNVGVCYSVGHLQSLNKRVVFKLLFPELSVSEVSSKWESIYPNPASDEINIKTDKKIKSSTLYDSSGRIVLKAETKNINVSSLQKGNYILRIQYDNGSEVSEKIVKE